MTQLLERLEASAGELDLSDRDLARAIGASSRTVSRWMASQTAPSRSSRERMLELVAVLERAVQVMEPEAAHNWLLAPNVLLGNEKPLELLREGSYREVLGAIDALGEGVFV